MEYPGSTFTKPRRLLFLALFFLIFIITSPLLVLFTIGYRYDVHNGLIKEIGAISIDVTPDDAIVFLNDTKLKNKIPVRLKDVSPGTYRIKITKPGYYDWNKEITVKSKQTVYIKDIMLIKKAEPKLLSADGDKLLSVSADGKYLVYTTQSPQTLRLRDTFNNKETALQNITFTTSSVLSWSKNNTFFTISTPEKNKNSLYIIKTVDPQTIWNLDSREKGVVTKFLWDAENDHTLYFSTSSSIHVADTNLGETSLLAANTYLDWYFTNGQLWTLRYATTTNELIVEQDTLGFINRFATLENIDRDSTETNKPILEFIQNRTVLLKNIADHKTILLNPEKSTALETTHFITSPTGWWLLWNPWELWSSLSGGDPYLLNRSSIAVRQAIFIDEYNTVATRSDTSISILFPYYLVNEPLLNAETITGLGVDSERRLLYFSGTLQGQTGVWELPY